MRFVYSANRELATYPRFPALCTRDMFSRAFHPSGVLDRFIALFTDVVKNLRMDTPVRQQTIIYVFRLAAAFILFDSGEGRVRGRKGLNLSKDRFNH